MDTRDPLGHSRFTPQRILGKVRSEIVRSGIVTYLAHRSRFSHSSLVDPSSPLQVSLASHGKRLDVVPFAIESIGRGQLRPSAVTLWVDPGARAQALRIDAIRRQVERGLQIRESQQILGPHTKYYPQVSQSTARQLLVTADDDVLYPRTWLKDLKTAHEETPDLVVCHRAHRLVVRNGRLLPYVEWPAVNDDRPHPTVFPAGVSGVLYPTAVQDALAAAGSDFLRYAPRADDIWLHFVITSSGFLARQVRDRGSLFLTVPRSQTQALLRHNVLEGGNDQQLAELYDGGPGSVLLPVFEMSPGAGDGAVRSTVGGRRPHGNRPHENRVPDEIS